MSKSSKEHHVTIRTPSAQPHSQATKIKRTPSLQEGTSPTPHPQNSSAINAHSARFRKVKCHNTQYAPLSQEQDRNTTDAGNMLSSSEQPPLPTELFCRLTTHITQQHPQAPRRKPVSSGIASRGETATEHQSPGLRENHKPHETPDIPVTSNRDCKVQRHNAQRRGDKRDVKQDEFRHDILCSFKQKRTDHVLHTW